MLFQLVPGGTDKKHENHYAIGGICGLKYESGLHNCSRSATQFDRRVYLLSRRYLYGSQTDTCHIVDMNGITKNDFSLYCVQKHQ